MTTDLVVNIFYSTIEIIHSGEIFAYGESGTLVDIKVWQFDNI